MSVLDVAKLEAQVGELGVRYRSARPFPHIVLDDLLEPEAAALAMKEFPALDRSQWNAYIHANERKFSNTAPATWGPTLQAVLAELNSPRFVEFLGALTGIDGLFPDESLEGGGLHQSAAGGFLNIHADYTVHPHHRHWRRRVNIILYLNDDWRPEYGGELELWSSDMRTCEQRVTPAGNRAVIFSTDADSFHGHPDPLRCPPELARRSLALYYFTYDDHPTARSTEYRARPGDGARRFVIFVDTRLLRAYDFAKRHLGLSDQSVSKLLHGVERVRTRWRGDRGVR